MLGSACRVREFEARLLVLWSTVASDYDVAEEYLWLVYPGLVHGGLDSHAQPSSQRGKCKGGSMGSWRQCGQGA